jgi:type I restriction enzyme S subunit
MAKAKVHAPVTNAEQPYTLPDGWEWVWLGDCCKFIGGGTPSKGIATFWNGSINWASIKDIKGDILYNTLDTITEAGLLNSSSRVCVIGDLILATRIAPGQSIVAGIPAAINQDLKIVETEQVRNYLHYFFMFKKDDVVRSSSGSTVLGISIAKLQQMIVPLPPPPTQQRIVSAIESLFSKLDRAKELAQSALERFDARRAAILHKAFTGELTREWRRVNSVAEGTWEHSMLCDVCYVQNGIQKGKKYNCETIKLPYLRVANVQDGYLDLGEIKLIEVEKQNASHYYLQNGDVLFTEGGDFDKLGRATVWHGEISFCVHQNHVFAVRPDSSKLDSNYLALFAGSKQSKEYFVKCSKQTTNLASINSKQLKAFPLALPTLPEQREIVRILDGVFAREKQARELCTAVIGRVALIKKAILARAFRGELVT